MSMQYVPDPREKAQLGKGLFKTDILLTPEENNPKLINKYGEFYLRGFYGDSNPLWRDFKVPQEVAERILEKPELLFLVWADVSTFKHTPDEDTSNDPCKVIIIADYLRCIEHYSYRNIVETIDALKTWPSLYNEMYWTLLYEKFPDKPVTAEGYTAQKLYETTFLTVIGAYNYMLFLKNDPKQALELLDKGLPRK